VTGFVRLPQMTDVASLKEQGLVFDAPPAYGLFGPKGMSPELTERINAALNRWLVSPQTVEFLATRQNMPRSDLTTPAQYARYLQQELVSWRKLMEQAGVKVK
jgi:tripartite-type tricarboxylate transporter receptor subunit TctC